MSRPIKSKDLADQIAKLYELHQSGALSDVEFENAKRRVLGEGSPRMVAQPPGVIEHEDEPKQPRAWWKVLLIAAGVLLLLGAAGALNRSEDTGSRDSVPTSTTTRSQGSVAMTTSVTTDEPSPIVELNGAILVHGELASSTEFGVDCTGVNNMDFIVPGEPLRVQAKGQKYLGPYELVHGRGNGEGACDFPFSGTIHLADSYQVIFEPREGSEIPPLMTTCSADEVWSDERMMFIHLHVYPDQKFAECVYPSHLD